VPYAHFYGEVFEGATIRVNAGDRPERDSLLNEDEKASTSRMRLPGGLRSVLSQTGVAVNPRSSVTGGEFGFLDEAHINC
jgi:hypothetical protein